MKAEETDTKYIIIQSQKAFETIVFKCVNKALALYYVSIAQQKRENKKDKKEATQNGNNGE